VVGGSGTPKRIGEGRQTVRRIALTSAVGVQFITTLIAEDEERIQKAVRSGKKPRPTKTRGGKTLPECFAKATELCAMLADARDVVRKDKSKKRAAELNGKVIELEDERLGLMDTLDTNKRQIAAIPMDLTVNRS